MLYTSAIPSVRLEEVYAAHLRVQRLCREGVYSVMHILTVWAARGTTRVNHGFPFLFVYRVELFTLFQVHVRLAQKGGESLYLQNPICETGILKDMMDIVDQWSNADAASNEFVGTHTDSCTDHHIDGELGSCYRISSLDRSIIQVSDDLH